MHGKAALPLLVIDAVFAVVFSKISYVFNPLRSLQRRFISLAKPEFAINNIGKAIKLYFILIFPYVLLVLYLRVFFVTLTLFIAEISPEFSKIAHEQCSSI